MCIIVQHAPINKVTTLSLRHKSSYDDVGDDIVIILIIYEVHSRQCNRMNLIALKTAYLTKFKLHVRSVINFASSRLGVVREWQKKARCRVEF